MLEIFGKIDRLKTLLATATDFIEPWGYFGDEIACHPGLHSLGKPSTDAKLRAALEASCSKVKRRPVKLDDASGIHVSNRGFWHGMFTLHDGIAIWFYFEQSDQGLVGIMRSPLDQRVELVRFSVVPLPPSAGFGPAGRGRA
jgi:hypothetical protein